MVILPGGKVTRP